MTYPPAVKDRPEIPSELVFSGHLATPVPNQRLCPDISGRRSPKEWFAIVLPLEGSTKSDGSIKRGLGCGEGVSKNGGADGTRGKVPMEDGGETESSVDMEVRAIP